MRLAMSKGKVEVPLDHKGRRLTKDGREIPDPVPMAPPVGYQEQPSMFEVLAEQVRQAQARGDWDDGLETPEEADDFDVADDPPDPLSRWEENFTARMVPDDDPELVRLARAFEDRQRALREQGGNSPGSSPTPAPGSASSRPQEAAGAPAAGGGASDPAKGPGGGPAS